MFRQIAVGVHVWFWVMGTHVQAQESISLSTSGCGAKHIPSSTTYKNARLSRFTTSNDTEDSLLILPIIVHIVHHDDALGTGDNLDASHTLSQLEVLNQDFRRIENTAGANENPLSADSYIGFIPAAQDSKGHKLTELGINRVNGSTFSWPEPPYSTEFIETQIKPATQWDPTQYINVWVLDIEGPSKGRAQFPDSSDLENLAPKQVGSSETDGFFVDTKQWGGENQLSFGRIATHEMGHFLGLIHTWGEGEGSCNTDDGCDDTPPAARETIGCPIASESCGSQDMTENYMDGSGGFCQNVFTKCQIARMRQVLLRSPRRRELASSPGGEIPVSNEIDLSSIIRLQDPLLDGDLKQIVLTASFPRSTNVKLSLFSLQGNTIRTLFNGRTSYGDRRFVFSYAFLPSGMYLVVWELEGIRIPQKLIIP